MKTSMSWRRGLVGPLAIALVIIMAGAMAFDASPAMAVPAGGMTAAQVNTMFASYGDAGGHWTGGDSTVSVLLPDGRVAWLFSDTFLGTVNADGTRPKTTPMVNNTLVVQDAANLVSTRTGGTASFPKALVEPTQPDEFFWVADGVVEGGLLKVLYNRYARFGGGGLDVELTGTSLATFTLPDLTLSSVTDLPVGHAITWGASVLVDGSFTYVYGMSSGLGNLKFGHVARAPLGSLGGAWQFWTGSTWSSDLAGAARLLSGVGTNYAVDKIGSQYVLITQDNNLVFDPQIVAYTASSPTGPFAGPIQLLTAPEQTAGSQKIVYSARTHPELARSGKILLSYDVNSLKNQDTYDDARLYRPRFVELDWPRPQPGSVPAAPAGFTATSDLDGVTHLTWSAVAGASAYRVHRRDVTGGQTHFVRHVAVSQASMDVGGLIPGHQYEFKVTASNSNGEGPFSPVLTITPRVDLDATVIQSSNTPESVPGQYLVRFKDSPGLRSAGVAAFAQELAAQAGGVLGRVYPRTLRGFSITLTESRAIDLVGHPDVQEVEQDQSVTLTSEQTNPPSWGLDRVDQRALPLDQKYIYPNAGGIYAYVVDTGIRITHNDFGGRAAYGRNTFDNNNNADDCNGHGTHVAGTLGGSSYGVAKGAHLVAVKAFDCQGRSQTASVADAVEWATNDAVQNNHLPAVMNMSLETTSRAVGFAVEAAIQSGITVVAAAGNSNADACVRLPARIPEVITVGNVDRTDTRHATSNFGSCVDLFAPGEDIVSATSANDTGARTLSGTSMSAPHVAGAAAIILTAHPEYGPDDVQEALRRAATPNVVVDPQGSPNLLLYVERPPTTAPANLTATANPNGTIGLSWQPVPEPGVHYLVSQRDVTAGEASFTRWAQPVLSGTTATATNLFEGHTYEFKVAASNSAGVGPESNVASAVAHTAPPAAPTNLTATAKTDGTIVLAWTAPGPGLWFNVYQRDVTAGDTTFTKLPLPVTTCCTMTAGYLTHNHEYEYKVTATNQGGEGPPSNLAKARSNYPAPAAPSGLTATPGDGQAVLTWTASATPNVWYRMYMRDVTAGEANFTQLALPITTCCTMTGGYLTNTHTYEFKVSATSQGGESAPSNVVQVTPQAPLPPKVTGLTATANTDGTIRLTWTSPSGPGFWYDIYQRDVTAGEATFTKLALPVTTCCTFTAGLLVHNHVYEYKVGATNGRVGPLSDPVQATARYSLPGAPTNLRGVSAGDGNITLTWDAPGPGPFYYWIYYRDVTAGQSFVKGAYPTDKATVSMGPLVHDHVYEFKVSASNQAGEGPASTTIQVTSRGGLPQPPSGLTATPGNGQVTLSWTASPTANVLYNIYQRNQTANGSWVKLPLPTSATTMTAGYLANGDTYEFKVTASNAAGDSAASNVATARPMPPFPQPPSGLTAAPGDGKVTLNWTASPTPGVWYWVEMRPAGGTWTRLPYPLSTCCTFDGSYLANGTTYEFRLRAYNIAGESTPSNVASARPMPPLPQAPSGLTAAPGDGKATLNWTASPTPNVWYWIEMRSAGGEWTRLPYPLTTCCTFLGGLLWNGTTYDFRVRATNLAGDSAPTNVASVRPMPPFPQPVSYLQGSSLPGAVFLWWTPSSTPNVLYNVYLRNRSRNGAWTVLPLPASGTSLTVTYLANREFYEFYVRAVNLSGSSAASNIVTLLAGTPYVQSDISCLSYYIRVKLPWGTITTGWVEVRAQAWGVAQAPEVQIESVRDVHSNGDWWYTEEAWHQTDSYGRWYTDNPMHEAALGHRSFELVTTVKGPSGEYWGVSYDQCYGA